jgi:transcriptional regulator with XRE-family HTH domain
VETGQGIPGWIRRQLARREWTAADLSRRTGVGTGRISEWMSGQRRPNPTSCIALAEAFGVDADDVLAIAGHRIPVEPVDPDDPRRRIDSLLRRVRLTPDRARTIEAILQTYLETDREG